MTALIFHFICKVDPSARTMRYKSWPFFPAWREIFGKDRAVGDEICVGQYTNDVPPVVDLADDEVDNETPECYVPTVEWCPNTGYAGNDSGTFAETQPNVDVNVTSTNSQKRMGSSGKKRKVKIIVQDDGLTNAVNTFCDSANERLDELSKKLFTDYEEAEIIFEDDGCTMQLVRAQVLT
ncbi:hypothetical protein Salat_0648900 [Sesamum alatum]|uniref:Uncharacterized protein n=1 Tax=Sesamum alatum TaxID=300844 RepID=A0AAE1YR69_9LAMI|nr:hypothetical protein Salat_0648900 [Sesamum alatum]